MTEATVSSMAQNAAEKPIEMRSFDRLQDFRFSCWGIGAMIGTLVQLAHFSSNMIWMVAPTPWSMNTIICITLSLTSVSLALVVVFYAVIQSMLMMASGAKDVMKHPLTPFQETLMCTLEDEYPVAVAAGVLVAWLVIYAMCGCTSLLATGILISCLVLRALVHTSLKRQVVLRQEAPQSLTKPLMVV